MLRGEVGARALRNPVGRGKGRKSDQFRGCGATLPAGEQPGHTLTGEEAQAGHQLEEGELQCS
jgi:hypothetical protein